MPAELRLGVVGLGRAAGLMMATLAAHPHVRLCAAADPNPEGAFALRARVRRPDVCRCRGALRERRGWTPCHIATPHQQHAADVIAAAAHGKHAIVEKPMALTPADCRLMTDAVRAAGTALVIGHTHAFDAPTMMIGDAIAGGTFGRLRTVVSLVYTNFLYRPRRPEELDSAQGGGIMFNQVPHQLEILQTLTRSPLRSVRAVSGIWDDSRPTEGRSPHF